MIIHLGPMAGTVMVVLMGMLTIRWRSGAADGLHARHGCDPSWDKRPDGDCGDCRGLP